MNLTTRDPVLVISKMRLVFEIHYKNERLTVFVHLSIILPLQVARVMTPIARNWERVHKPRSERHLIPKGVVFATLPFVR